MPSPKNQLPLTPQELANYIKQATDDQLEILWAWFDMAKQRAIKEHGQQLADLLDYRNERSYQITSWRDSQLDTLAKLDPSSTITLASLDPMPTPYVTGDITIKNTTYPMTTRMVTDEDEPNPQTANSTDSFDELRRLINRLTEQRLNKLITKQLTSLAKQAQSLQDTKFGPADFPPVGNIGSVIIGAKFQKPPLDENPTGTWWVYASNPPSWIRRDTITHDSPLADQPLWYGSPYGPKYPTTSWDRQLQADRANYPHKSYGDCHHLPGWTRLKCCPACHDDYRKDTTLTPIGGLNLCCKAAEFLVSTTEFITDRLGPDPDPPNPTVESNMTQLAAIYEDLPHYHPCPKCQIPMDLTTSTYQAPGYLAEWQCPRCGFALPYPLNAHKQKETMQKNLTDSDLEGPTCPNCKIPLSWDDGSFPSWEEPETPPSWFCTECGYEQWTDQQESTNPTNQTEFQFDFNSTTPNLTDWYDLIGYPTTNQPADPTSDQPANQSANPTDNQPGRITALQADYPIQAPTNHTIILKWWVKLLEFTLKTPGQKESTAAAKRGIAASPHGWLLLWLPILATLAILMVYFWPK